MDLKDNVGLAPMVLSEQFEAYQEHLARTSRRLTVLAFITGVVSGALLAMFIAM